MWEPAAAVVFAGRRCDCGPRAQPETSAATSVPSVAADVCCESINFFGTTENAERWARSHPEVIGQVLSRDDALRTGVQIFGPLLSAR